MWLSGLIFLFTLCGVFGQGPPETKTYRAIGELIGLDDESKPDQHTQVYFEENYDAVEKRASLLITTSLTTVTIVEYLDLNQMFIYLQTSSMKECRAVTPDEFLKSALSPVPLKSLIVKGNNVVFPVRQLLSLEKPQNKGTVQYRDIPALTWSYKLQDGPDVNIEIDGYWSDGIYNSPSKTKQVPLGFQVKKTKGKQNPTILSVNLFSFTHDEFNEQLFEPMRGVHCEGRNEKHDFLDVSEIKTLAYQSEHVWEDYQRIKFVDAVIDSEAMLYRADIVPSSSLPPKTVTKIVSKNQGVVYEIRKESSTGCLLSNISDTQFDPQTIIDYRQDGDWSIESLFGINSVNPKYLAVGKTSERGIPCVLYHGVRKNWPKDVTGITTLWEWCIANDKSITLDFPRNRYPVISLNIYITESPYTESTGLYYKGLRFTHHFYNAKNMNAKYMDAIYFEIGECFDETNSRQLSFQVDGDSNSLKQISNLDTNHEFVYKWKEGVNNAANLSATSMRVSSLRVVSKSSIALVNFVLLGSHPSLPVEEIGLDEAYNKLKSVIDDGKMKISFQIGNATNVNLFAKPGSLTSKVRIEDYDAPLTYSAGIMAAVAIVMILLGIAVGAGATFTRYSYSKN